jgi:predicted GIY-YIG superfamily endonuclease
VAGVVTQQRAAGQDQLFTLYRFRASDDTLLYIGITVNPGQRFVDHAHKKQWWSQVATIALEQHDDYPSLVAAEREAIQEEKPLHNVIHNGRRVVAPPVRLYKGMERGKAYGLALHNGDFLICLVEDGDEMGVGVIPWTPTNELFAGQPHYVDGSEIARVKTCGLMSVEDKLAEGYLADDDVFDLSTLTGYAEFWADRQRLKERIEEDMETW